MRPQNRFSLGGRTAGGGRSSSAGRGKGNTPSGYSGLEAPGTGRATTTGWRYVLWQSTDALKNMKDGSTLTRVSYDEAVNSAVTCLCY